MAAVMRRIDPVDLKILGLEQGGPGPHFIEAGVNLDDYEARLAALIDDPDAAAFAPDAIKRLRRGV